MGVKDLWSILEPCLEKSSLDELSGSKVAVDLGFWVCEMKAAIQNVNVPKPYLRNLFFRIWALLQRNIIPIFVTEGNPPDIKQQTIQNRQLSRKQIAAKSVLAQCKDGKIVKRTKFDACLRECCQLIQHLGLLFVESDGEAEAVCASLNFSGIVDAVITDDGDALLYGARTVYRNFNLEGQTIENSLNLSREKLIALALLVGCDYCPKGVPGVGKENAIKFIEDFPDVDLLKKFKNWSLTDNTDLSLLKSEEFIKRKALKMENFPNEEVINEFLRPRNIPITLIKETICWTLPDLTFLHQFLSEKLEWQSEYIIAKVIPFITLWTLKERSENDGSVISVQRILRQTTKCKIDVYEVQWVKLASDVWTNKDYYVTLEQKSFVDKVYPNLVAEFIETKAKKVKAKCRKGSKKQNLNVPNDQLLNNSAILFDANDDDDEERFVNKDYHRKGEENFVITELTTKLDRFSFEENNKENHNHQVKQVSKAEALSECVDSDDCLDNTFDSPLPLSKRLQLLLPKHQNSLLLKK